MRSEIQGIGRGMYLDTERAFDPERDRDSDFERERRDDLPLGDLLQNDSLS